MSEIVNPQNGNFQAEYMSESLEDILSNCYEAVNAELKEYVNMLIMIDYARKNAISIAAELNTDSAISESRYSAGVALLEQLSKAIGLGTGLAQNDKADVVSALASLLVNIGKEGDPDVNTTLLDRMRSVLTVFSGGLSLDKAILKMVGLKEDATTIGIIGSSIGIYSDLLKAAERDLAEQLKASGGVITKGSTLARGIYHFSGSGKQTEHILSSLSEERRKYYNDLQTSKVNAIVSLFSMGTYAVGDIISRVKDGVYDINDYGDTLLATGVNGLSSLTSSFTFGAVNIDVDRSISVFDTAITKAQDIIKGTGAPTSVQVALVIPGTVLAAGVGVVGTFIDYGMQIGENIMNFFWEN